MLMNKIVVPGFSLVQIELARPAPCQIKGGVGWAPSIRVALRGREIRLIRDG